MKIQKMMTLAMAALLALSLAACAATGGLPQGGGAVVKDGDTIGTGSAEFKVKVTDEKGESITFTVKSDTEKDGEAVILGEVLQDLGVLQGEEGPYGLYIKTINGRTADYETDGLYWAFYIDGAYAMEGADYTEVKADMTYEFRLEK